MGEQSRSGRIEYIDLARAFGILVMVSFHLLRRGPYTNLMNLMILPVFFYLTGYVRAIGRSSRHQSFFGYVRKRARSILLPYFLVGLVSILIYQMLGSYAGSRLGVKVNTSFGVNLLHLLYGSGKNGAMKWNESLWFLPCIFCMNLIAEIIERMPVRGIRARNAMRSAAAVLCLLAGRLLAGRGAVLPWHLETALANLFWTEAGIMTGEYLAVSWTESQPVHTDGRDSDSRRSIPVSTSVSSRDFCISRLILCGLCICAIILLTPHLGKVSFRTDEYDHYFTALLCGAVCVLLIMTVCRAVQKSGDGARWLRISGSVGERSMDIMLWNKFPVLFCQTILPVILPGFEKTFLENNTPGGLVICLLLAIPCLLLCLLWTDIYKIIIKKCTIKLHKLNKNP